MYATCRRVFTMRRIARTAPISALILSLTCAPWNTGPHFFFPALNPIFLLAAPLNEHDMTDIEYYPVADSTGCYYNFQHYDEGDRIITNEPCLNCTCHNRMLMCYLRVCPFTKAIGQDCKVEKRADQCCPVITCPEGTSTITKSTNRTNDLISSTGATFDNINHPIFHRSRTSRRLRLLHRRSFLL
jgi:hypothetical protein